MKKFYWMLRSRCKRLKKLIRDETFRSNERLKRLDLVRLKKVVGSWTEQLKSYPSANEYFAIVSFTDLPLHAKFHGLLSAAVKLRGMKTMIIRHKGGSYAPRCFELFGVDKVVAWPDMAQFNTVSKAEVDKFLSENLYLNIPIDSVMNIKYKGVEIGKHSLSMTCRKRIEGRLDLGDEKSFQQLKTFAHQAIDAVNTANVFFNKYPIKKVVVRDSGYIPNGPIYEVALQKNIDCIVLEFGQRKSSWIFKRHIVTNKNQHYFSLSDETWNKLVNIPWTEEKQILLDKEFDSRYADDADGDIRRLQSGKKEFAVQEIHEMLDLDPKKKTVIVFSHVAWDAAFFYGSGLFSDFEEWLFQTVKHIKKFGNDVNWIIKVHPFNVFRLQRETVDSTSEMRLLRPLFPLPDYVKLVQPDTPINTKSFFSIADAILTVNGTVGMEFPCFGIPAVIAGNGRYNGKGFTIEPKSQEEYFELLNTIGSLPKLSQEQITLARRHFYYLMRGKQIMFDDVAPMELLKIHEAQNDLHDNIHLNNMTLDEFAKAESVRLVADWITNEDSPDIIDHRQI